MGFSRQEYWSGLPFPSPGALPDPGIKPRSPVLQADSLLSEPPESYHKVIPKLKTQKDTISLNRKDMYLANLKKKHTCNISSVQSSRSVMYDSLLPHGLQHSRPSCPSPTPRVYPNPCPSSRRCHPTISSSVVPFSSCLQPFPASGSFQMSQLFTSGGHILEFQLQHHFFQ